MKQVRNIQRILTAIAAFFLAISLTATLANAENDIVRYTQIIDENPERAERAAAVLRQPSD